MTTPQSDKPNASALRQLIAAIYDGLLLIAVLLIAAAITVPLTQAGIIKPDNPLLSLYLFSVCFLFYAWFWVHGGQTLGMHVWHIRLEQNDGSPLTWRQAFMRFICGLPAWTLFIFSLVRLYVPEQFQANFFADWLMAIKPVWLLLLGCVWLVADHWKKSWRDKLTGTHIVKK